MDFISFFCAWPCVYNFEDNLFKILRTNDDDDADDNHDDDDNDDDDDDDNEDDDDDDDDDADLSGRFFDILNGQKAMAISSVYSV